MCLIIIKVKKIVLGNINIRRDWGWANDYVKAIHLINSNKKMMIMLSVLVNIIL